MKSPLRKRLPRELKSEIGKYLIVFILMVTTIGFVSGFLVADGSMLIAYNESLEICVRQSRFIRRRERKLRSLA